MRFGSSIVVLFAALFIFTQTACSVRPADEKYRTRSNVIILDDEDRGWLGVSIDNISASLARKKGFPSRDGAYVRDVEKESPAEKAGIREGDVITEFNGTKIYDSNDLVEETRETKPGTDVSIVVLRDGKNQTMKATVGNAPRSLSFAPGIPPHPRTPMPPHFSFMTSTNLYGLTLEELNKQLGEYFGAPDGKGVLVKNVQRNSDADKAGFKAGDVITKVGKATVEEIDDLIAALDDYNKGDKAEIQVLRKGTTQTLTLPVSDRDNGVSMYRFEKGKHFRLQMDQLRDELESMQLRLHDNMRDLNEKLQLEIEHALTSAHI